MKIVVVGGGSTYTPELIDGIARLQDEVPISEIVLVDPAQDRRELLAAVSQRILSRYGTPATVRGSTDVTEAADGAAAVLMQLRVGGQAARERDETWPLECGCVGQETTGAGGFAKALRTVPVVLGIADQVRAVNPDAWIVDFTNPVGIVTRALLQAEHKAIGLCNVAIGLQRRFAELLDVDAGPGESGPRRTQPPDLGARGAGAARGGRPVRRRTRTSCPPCCPSISTRSPNTWTCLPTC